MNANNTMPLNTPEPDDADIQNGADISELPDADADPNAEEQEPSDEELAQTAGHHFQAHGEEAAKAGRTPVEHAEKHKHDKGVKGHRARMVLAAKALNEHSRRALLSADEEP